MKGQVAMAFVVPRDASALTMKREYGIEVDRCPACRGAWYDAAELASFFRRLSELHDLIGRAGSYASLKFSVDSNDPANGALLAKVEERSTAVSTKLIFVDLEWAAADDAQGWLLVPGEANYRGRCVKTVCDRVNVVAGGMGALGKAMLGLATGREVETGTDAVTAVAHGTGAVLVTGQAAAR